MNRRFLLCIALGLISFPLLAETDAPKDGGEEKNTVPPSKATGAETRKTEREPEEKPKQRPGKVTLGTSLLSYVAQTGTIPVLKEDGGRLADVFYVYYAATDEKGQRLALQEEKRPIMCCFNGGPGASAVWLHLGGLGPKRVDLPPEGLSPVSFSKVVENPHSILDATDLVFVDPVSTGLSRAAKGEKPDQFFGVNEDIRSVGEFVRLFSTREQRWASPKYLCGESYGVMRVAGLARYLQSKHGLYPEGLVLLSGLIDFQTLLPSSGNDLPHLLFLPTMTATAHYHGKLEAALQANLEKAVEEARAFAQGEYALALLAGNALPEAARAKVARQLARFTGLTPEEILRQNLRLDPSYFRKALLAKEGRVVGRFDARVTGLDAEPGETTTGFDPSYSNIAGGFASAINAYVRKDLGYESDHPYHILNHSLPWRWHSFENKYVSMGDALANAIQNNPRMRTLVLCGRRDMAVPEDSMRYSLGHLPIPAGSQGNIRFSLYESGHMMYLFEPDARKLRADLVEFVRQP
ncbi:MAG: hypothetical protein RLZZ399_474 [Verrucomicrobiota bacterium]|jgi:carboxypeptidase C (cathepsin A)